MSELNSEYRRHERSLRADCCRFALLPFVLYSLSVILHHAWYPLLLLARSCSLIAYQALHTTNTYPRLDTAVRQNTSGTRYTDRSSLVDVITC